MEEAATVIPLFCFDPRHFGRTEFGFEKTGKYRARFLIDSVHDLRESLRKRASDLVVRIGKPEDILPALVKKTGARAVFLHSEVTYEDRQVETDLEKRLKKQGSELQTFWTNTLYHNEDLPFDIENMPDVYSDFRVAVEKSGIIRTPLPAPESLSRLPKGLSVGEVPTLRALGVSDIPITPTRVNSTGVSTITGGEAEAMARVKSYVEERRRMDAESSLRSEVTANLTSDFSCRISPWLAVGCISPRRIFDDMKVGSPNPERLLNSSTYFELVWRDFFKCITAKYAGKRSSGLLSTPRRKTMVGV